MLFEKLVNFPHAMNNQRCYPRQELRNENCANKIHAKRKNEQIYFYCFFTGFLRFNNIISNHRGHQH